MRLKHLFRMILAVLMTFQILAAENGYVPSPENLKNREWYQDSKFGLFVHWGVYSILGDGEWALEIQKIDKQAYEKLPTFFNPIDFNPAEWVALVKAAGMQYVTITTRHHDGFAMFDTQQSDWDIVDRTPYKKDIIRMLADECHRQGIKLFFYYSHVDWCHDDYYPRGSTGRHTGRPESGDWKKYIDFINVQLTELLTNYGEISGIWFDGYWDRPDADWQFEKTYRLIHALQPQCLIGNNHHQAIKPGEDFQTFEKDLPGRNTAGYSGESEVGSLPLETCETMNHSWGFNLLDNNFKSSRELIQYLVKTAGNNANFLLNVGPMPNGKIQPECVVRLREIGQWIEKNGESIYGTRGGPVPPQPWGVTTRKGNRVFVHVLSPDGPNILIPDFGKKIKKITLFADGTKIKFKQDEFGITMQIPEGKIDSTDIILVIEI